MKENRTLQQTSLLRWQVGGLGGYCKITLSYMKHGHGFPHPTIFSFAWQQTRLRQGWDTGVFHRCAKPWARV